MAAAEISEHQDTATDAQSGIFWDQQLLIVLLLLLR